MWREVRRALEAGAADRRVLNIGILGRLKESIHQVSDKLIFSEGMGRSAVVDDSGRKRVQGNSIGRLYLLLSVSEERLNGFGFVVHVDGHVLLVPVQQHVNLVPGVGLKRTHHGLRIQFHVV